MKKKTEEKPNQIRGTGMRAQELQLWLAVLVLSETSNMNNNIQVNTRALRTSAEINYSYKVVLSEQSFKEESKTA